MSRTQLIQTEHMVPAPDVAGWTEATRLAEFERLRAVLRDDGGLIIAERRIRNDAFDKRGERTTLLLTVKWR